MLLPLGLPALLVGDGALGGISNTLCASEALTRRGVPLVGVVLIDGVPPCRGRAGTHRRRLAGPSGAALSARSGLGPRPSLGQPACSAALAGHTGLVFDTGGLDNHVALGEHLHPVPVTLLPPLAKGPGGAEVSEEEIAGWLETAAPQFEGLLSQLVPK